MNTNGNIDNSTIENKIGNVEQPEEEKFDAWEMMLRSGDKKKNDRINHINNIFNNFLTK